MKIDKFFQKVRPDFILKILYGGKPTAITGDEVRILDEADTILEINAKTNGHFAQILRKLNKTVEISDALDFVLECDKYNYTSDALEIIDAAVKENLELTVDGLYEALGEVATGIPPTMMVNLLGRERVEEPAPAPHKSGLNLDNFRNFR